MPSFIIQGRGINDLRPSGRNFFAEGCHAIPYKVWCPVMIFYAVKAFTENAFLTSPSDLHAISTDGVQIPS